MTFIEQIEKLKKEKDLFYNKKGNKKYYQLFIRHISFAKNLGYGFIANNEFHPKKEITIIDLEKETIKKITKKIRIINE